MADFRSSVGEDLLSALVTAFSAATSAEVTRGLPVGISSGDYLGVGVTDPTATRPVSAITSTIEWSGTIPEGGFDESGEVAVAAVAVRGSDDLAEPTAAVYALLAAVVGYLRTHWTPSDLLGVSGLWDLKPTDTDLQTLQDENGAAAYLLIRFSFRATI